MWKVLIVLALVVGLLFILDVVLGRSPGESWFLRNQGKDRHPARGRLSVAEFFTGPVAVMVILIGLPLSLKSFWGEALLVTGTGLLCFRLGMSYARKKDREEKKDADTSTP